MMASIPNMRSTPLPVPTGKAAPAGDAAAGGFTVELPTVPPGTVQPCAVAPPIQFPTAAELLDSLAPAMVAPEGDEETADGDKAAPAKADAPTDDGQPEAAVLVPFVPPEPAVLVPFVQPVGPGPQVMPVAIDGVPPADSGATAPAPVALPGGVIVTGRTGKAVPTGGELPQEDTEAPDLTPAPVTDPIVKALLQRKPLPGKQVAAKAEATDTATAKAQPAQTQAETRQTPAPPAPMVAQAAAPIATAEPQPALSPTASQPAPAVADKPATVEATSTADLAAERKLDLARDGAWLDRLARDIARSASDETPLRFRLHPQTLGHLQVELQQGDRGTAVRMTVDTEAARQILSDAQPRLAAEARAQGVRIAETHVDLSGSGRQAPGDQRRQDEARQTPFIRTATGPDAASSARSARRARLDRYA
jgi:hypothetical protein